MKLIDAQAGESTSGSDCRVVGGNHVTETGKILTLPGVFSHSPWR